MATKKLESTEGGALALYDEVTETGFEDTSADDYSIPFLKLFQKGSPQCDADDGAFVEGAKPGIYYNTATGELMDAPVVIPCFYRRAMVEWRDRDDGGGFLGQHEVGYEKQFERDERGRYVTGQGTHLVDTRYLFCIMEGEMDPVVIAFTSTQLKKAKALMTTLSAQRTPKGKPLPILANRLKFTSVPEQNDQGSWRGYKIERLGRVEDTEVFRVAQEAREMFKGASSNIKPPEEERAAKDDLDDEVPF